MQCIINEVKEIRIRSLHEYELGGIGKDEWDENSEALHGLVDDYLGDSVQG